MQKPLKTTRNQSLSRAFVRGFGADRAVASAVELEVGKSLEMPEAIKHVYFPEDGIVSVVATMPQGMQGSASLASLVPRLPVEFAHYQELG